MTSTYSMSVFAAALAVLSCVPGISGCTYDSRSLSFDKPTAQKSLVDALDAWQSGQSLTDFSQKHPGWVVVDQDWQAGAKLTEFTVVNQERDDGKNLHAAVQALLEQDSTKRDVTLLYTIGTSPQITIFREE